MLDPWVGPVHQRWRISIMPQRGGLEREVVGPDIGSAGTYSSQGVDVASSILCIRIYGPLVAS